ncbi:MAG: peptidoglycan-associated lipoprotein Pal [Betaproteobacteria bacterium]|nr:peptidoglycan-associated lipoprotein Pal [Betaproteobacteria bacterium]
MRMSVSIVAALVVAIAGCSSTEDKRGDAVRPQQPVPDKVPPVATAAPRTNLNATDDLAVLRDPNSLLSKRSIYFDYDNYDVKSEYAKLLEQHGKFLAARQRIKIMVQGSADERGSHEYNLALGQKRAEAVRRALVLHGVKDGQIEAVSFGEEKPRTVGHNEEAWSQNRRADLVYPGE